MKIFKAIEGGKLVTRRAFLHLLETAAALGLAGCGMAESAHGEPTLVATFFNVGKADAIALQGQEGTVLVDSGTADASSKLLDMITDLGIESIDAFIITHFDQDHVGGASAILNNIPVKEVYVTYQSKDSHEIQNYQDAMRALGLTATELPVGSTRDLSVGGMELHLIAPKSADYGKNDTSNDSSLVTRVACDGVTLLLTGDVERDRIDELLAGGEDLSCDILKMPHHGGHEKNTAKLIAACAPSCAVITCSDDDKEDEETVDDLEKADVSYYVTREGTVTATVANGSFTVEQGQK